MFEILFFILGLAFGSFLNVVLFRYGTGLGFGGRSRCASSGRVLRWYELIPVISFFVQGGRSRYTGSRLSWQYPLVEFVTGVLFAGAYIFAFQQSLFVDTVSFLALLLVSLSVVSLVVLICVYDIRHMIIPNEFSYPLIGLSFISLFISLDPFIFTIPSMSALFAGPLVALPFVLFWFVSRGRWMGFADAKLALAMGWFLGLSSGFAAVLLAFWFGAIISIVVLVFSKQQKKQNALIPFAPFLLAGFLLTVVYNISIETLMLLFVFV